MKSARKSKAPKITGLDGVALNVSDFGRSVAFYRGVLGLKVGVLAPGHFAMVREISLGLLCTGKKVVSKGFHLEIAVDDVDQWYAYLKAKGVDVSEPKNEDWGERNIYFDDPDGHEIEMSSGIR